MSAYFEIQGQPQGKGRPKFARVGSYTSVRTPDQTVLYENLIKVEYRNQCKNLSFGGEVPLELRIEAFYSIPKAMSKKKRAAMEIGEIRPIKKPDVDNVLKVVADALNNIAYRDDAQIVETKVSKFYSDTPRVCVWIDRFVCKE